MTRVARAIVVFWLGCAAMADAQEPVAQQPATPQRAETVPSDSVPIYATVRRARIQPGQAAAAARTTASLTRFDFDLRDDGEGREVLESVTNLPLSLVLILDVSSSLRHLGDVANLPADVARALGPDDRISVGRFGNGETAFTPFTRESGPLQQAARDLKQAVRAGSGPSPIWDAVNASISALERQPGRPAIVLITDGRVTGNLTRFEFVLQHALAAGVTIHTIVQGVPFYGLNLPADVAFAPPWAHPRRIALATGGFMVSEPDSSGMIREIVEGHIRELRGGYRLRFKPYRLDGKPHPVSVRVRTPGFLVRAPESYTPPRR